MNPSTIIALVQADLFEREKRGLSKYGTTVDRKDLTEDQWLQHAYEEALDLAVYLKKTILSKKDDALTTLINSSKWKYGISLNVGDKVKLRRTGKIGTIARIIYKRDTPYYIGNAFYSEDELELIE